MSRGKNGFRRRDHLFQHIRGYHKINADEKLTEIRTRDSVKHESNIYQYPDCEFHPDHAFKQLPFTDHLKARPFLKKSDYTKHIKEARKETPFPCNVRGCETIEGKGYVRVKDLIRHRQNQHPSEGQYYPQFKRSTPESPAGCGILLRTNNLTEHPNFSRSKTR